MNHRYLQVHESHKYVEQKKLHLYKVQEQARLVNGNRNQDSGFLLVRRGTKERHENIFQGESDAWCWLLSAWVCTHKLNFRLISAHLIYVIIAQLNKKKMCVD